MARLDVSIVSLDGTQVPMVTHDGVRHAVMAPGDEFKVVVSIVGDASEDDNRSYNLGLRVDGTPLNWQMANVKTGSRAVFDGWMIAKDYRPGEPTMKRAFRTLSPAANAVLPADEDDDARERGRIVVVAREALADRPVLPYNDIATIPPVDLPGSSPAADGQRDDKKWYRTPGLTVGAGTPVIGGQPLSHLRTSSGSIAFEETIVYDAVDRLVLRGVLRLDAHAELLSASPSAAVRTAVARLTTPHDEDRDREEDDVRVLGWRPPPMRIDGAEVDLRRQRVTCDLLDDDDENEDRCSKRARWIVEDKPADAVELLRD